MKVNPEDNLQKLSKDCRQIELEKSLLAEIANNNESALEKLYVSYYSRLLRFITRITSKTDQLDEIINEVMYVVWNKAGTYNHTCKPSTWIFGIAYNKARKSMQKSKFDQAESLEAMNQENSLLGRNDAGLTQLELNNWLESALKTLSSEQRTVVELSFFHGMHYKEIAELMKCPENTIKTRMYYARKKLDPILRCLKGFD